MDGTDFEDAVHLYLTFVNDVTTEELESYVDEFEVGDYHAELEGV